MAALRTEAATKSFFNSPSFSLRKLVNALPRPQRFSPESSEQLLQGRLYEEQQFQPKTPADRGDKLHGAVDLYATRLERNDGSEDECADACTSSAADVDDGNSLADETEYSSSNESMYLPPRKELLPYDFSIWQNSPSADSSISRESETFAEVLSSNSSREGCAEEVGDSSEIEHSYCNEQREYHQIPSFSKGRRNTNYKVHYWNASTTHSSGNASTIHSSARSSSTVADNHLQEARRRLPDSKLDAGFSTTCKYSASMGLKSLPVDCWSDSSGASEDGKRDSVDASYRSEGRVFKSISLGFHAADMVQERDTLYQKYLRDVIREGDILCLNACEVPHGIRMDIQNTYKGLNKKNDIMVEEQGTQPRQSNRYKLSCLEQSISDEDALVITKLQNQVKELQCKLSTTRHMLISYHYASDPEDECSRMLLLLKNIEELQIKLSQKEHLLESVQKSLAQKEKEIKAMQACLNGIEGACSGLRDRCIDGEDKAKSLMCKIGAMESPNEVNTLDDSKKTQDLYVAQRQLYEQDRKVCRMEAVRKMYLAALVVAKLVPRDECLALLQLLRVQLQHIANVSTKVLA
ncbi:hypothetical protein KP509_29G074900 [Ceratopteris richardii]|uniref:Uncharacterized protein n=1 Tax=Ceratopteris richardii TaxID=49495 RepID=A0A8T2R9W9_CERRI|nr:hypothetical protein KP509_29G074900 [Ceratopteris richardii]